MKKVEMGRLFTPRNRGWLLLAVWGLVLLPWMWHLWVVAVWPIVRLYWTWQLTI